MRIIKNNKQVMALIMAILLMFTFVFTSKAQTRSTYSNLYYYMNIYENKEQVAIDDRGNFTFIDGGDVEYNIGLNGDDFTYHLFADRDWNEVIELNVTTSSKTNDYELTADYIGEADLYIYNEEQTIMAEIIPDEDEYEAYLKEQLELDKIEELEEVEEIMDEEVEVEETTDEEIEVEETTDEVVEETTDEVVEEEVEETTDEVVEEEVEEVEEITDEDVEEDTAKETTDEVVGQDASEQNFADELNKSTDAALEENLSGVEELKQEKPNETDKLSLNFNQAIDLQASEITTEEDRDLDAFETLTPELDVVETPDNELIEIPELYYEIITNEPSDNYQIGLSLPAGEYQIAQAEIAGTIPRYEFDADYSAISSFQEDISKLIGEVAPLIYVYKDDILTDQLFVAQNRILWISDKTIKLSHEFAGIMYEKYITIPDNHSDNMTNDAPVVAGYDYGDAPSSYKGGGTYVDYDQVYQLALNNDNSASNVIIDTEDEFIGSDNGELDDITGIDDDDAIVGQDNNQIDVNIVDGVFYLNIAYQVDSEAELGVWFDSDLNGKYDKDEAYIYSLTTGYGTQQYKTLAFPLSTTDLTASDSTYLRLRIVEGSGMKAQDADKDISRVGETEDVKINFYEQSQNEISQVCNATYTNSNIFTIQEIEAIDDGYIYTFDTGALQDATLTIAGDGVFEVHQTNPLSFTFDPYNSSDQILEVYLRDAEGNPLHLPLQWTLSFLNGSAEVQIDKDELYQRSLTSDDFQVLKDNAKIYVSDQDDYWKIIGTKYTNNLNSSSIMINTDTISGSDMQITQPDGEVTYSLSLNTNEIQEATNECNDNLELLTPELEAYVEKYSGKYYDYVGLYKGSDFDFVVENIQVPEENDSLEAIEHKFTRPEKVNFNPDKDIEVYKRKIDSGNAYVQMSSGYEANYGGSVKINDWEEGYEYKIIYPLRTDNNFNKNQTSYLNSAVYYHYKKESIQVDLPEIILNGLQSFDLKFSLTMGDDMINVESMDPLMAVEDYGIYYSAKKNCGNCTSSKKLALTSEGIPIESVEIGETGDFNDTKSYKVEIYDDKFKVAQFNIKQWKPTQYAGDDLAEINDNVNPVQHVVYYSMGYDEEVVESEAYVGEEFIPVDYDISQVDAGKVEVQIAMTVSNDISSVPSSWNNIDEDEIEAGDVSAMRTYYIAPKTVNLYIPEDYLDATLETPIKEIKGNDYKTMSYTLTGYYNETDGTVPKLRTDDNYIIEEFSGRMYNEGYGTLYIPTTDTERIADGANDALDDDLRVSDYIENQFLIAQAAPSTDFTYYQEIVDFGLNQVAYNHEFEASDQYKIFGYFENESAYFVQPQELTAEETQCLKNDLCPQEMIQEMTGTVTAAQAIADELTETPGKIHSVKTLNAWIDKYIE